MVENQSTDLNMVTLSTAIANAVANANPTKTLCLPPFTPSDTKTWLHSIIIQLSYTTFFTPLLNSDQSFVSTHNANKNPTVDAALYTQLSKTIPAITMNILNPDSTSKSGVAILVLLQAKISMSKTPNDIDILYRNWCNMAKGKNETVEDYTARAVQFKKDLFGTEKEIKQPEFVRKWRQGFGTILAPINLAIDDLLQDPPMWRDDVPLFQLMETAKGYIAKHSPSSKSNTSSSPKTTPTITKTSTTNNNTTSLPTTSSKQSTQTSNLPQNFSSLEAWHRYVKKTIGTYGFLDNTDLESGSKFAGTISNGCYFCRMNNHTYLQCGPLNEFKRLALVAKESTDTSTVSARANLLNSFRGPHWR